MGSGFSRPRAEDKLTALFFQCTRRLEWKIQAFGSMSSLNLWSLTPCLLFPAPVNYQKGTSEGNQALVLANVWPSLSPAFPRPFAAVGAVLHPLNSSAEKFNFPWPQPFDSSLFTFSLGQPSCGLKTCQLRSDELPAKKNLINLVPRTIQGLIWNSTTDAWWFRPVFCSDLFPSSKPLSVLNEHFHVGVWILLLFPSVQNRSNLSFHADFSASSFFISACHSMIHWGY